MWLPADMWGRELERDRARLRRSMHRRRYRVADTQHTQDSPVEFQCHGRFGVTVCAVGRDQRIDGMTRGEKKEREPRMNRVRPLRLGRRPSRHVTHSYRALTLCEPAQAGASNDRRAAAGNEPRQRPTERSWSDAAQPSAQDAARFVTLGDVVDEDHYLQERNAHILVGPLQIQRSVLISSPSRRVTPILATQRGQRIAT